VEKSSRALGGDVTDRSHDCGFRDFGGFEVFGVVTLGLVLNQVPSRPDGLFVSVVPAATVFIFGVWAVHRCAK
jgi:hypothetical protein